MKYRELIKKYEKICRDNQKEASVVKLLILDLSGMNQIEVLNRLEEECSVEFETKMFEALHKYVHHNIPIQYIIGHTYFHGLKIEVNPFVLIPRFETEELVENILYLYDEIFGKAKVKLVDVGTGSGCIALALKNYERELMDVYATDISEEALEVAKKNAQDNDLEIQFLSGDMLKPLFGRKFDIIVSNPPYIPRHEHVDHLVKDNEPHLALFADEDGLKFYHEIIENAKDLINKPALLAFEHAYNTKDRIRQIALDAFPGAKIIQKRDLQGKDRMTFIIIE